ncbi:uncharacterized protein LOC110446360 isoform X2 [Mizuhopecten yessoensis]|uniref:uncharacterized protein LOC110446360 isoform X2 n=1 Tax=Mizuhopecten yessoensis TaxID=6573 RepID=UPI000B457B8D|nr:uncharacterized protein LOC110446360 isoform X2 [Mizuhopecten yessoensis]
MATGESTQSSDQTGTMSSSIPLHNAVRRRNLDQVQELVMSGADLGARDGKGQTPLMCAIASDCRLAADFIAKKMTFQDLNVVDNDGYNVFHMMAFFDCRWSQMMQDISDVCPTLFRQKDRAGQRPINIASVRSRYVYRILEQFEREQQKKQQQQYTTGIAENEEHPCNITITVVGHKGVGKSCFVRQLKKENIPEGGPGSTDTADVFVNYVGYNPNTGFRQQLNDDGEVETGRQRLKRLIDQHRKEQNIAVKPSADTSDRLPGQKEGSASPPTPPTVDASVLPARNKTDKEVQQETVPQEQRRKQVSTSENTIQKKIPMEQKKVIQAVMRTKLDCDGAEEVKGYVTIYDFGGEKVFYNTHHCFMSSNMVFVLVFDVAMCLDPSRAEDGYERIEFWLRSIATYAIDRAAHGKGCPPIILVGSHLDLLSRNKEEQNRLFTSVLEKLYKKPELREIIETHVQEMFPIADLNDSTKHADVYQRVWTKIIEIAPLQSQWMKPVPARWVALEYELVRLKNSGMAMLTYAKLLGINKKLAVPLVEDDIREFLWKLKFFGSFLCFDLHSKRPFIILQPQWIINAFKSIITDPRFITELTIKQKLEWTAYEKSGVLPVTFIRQLWGRHEEFRFLEKAKYLYIALETLGLLSKPLSVDAEVNYFIVPSILQNADPKIICPVLDDPDTVKTVTLCLKFDNPFIPQAVWDKMIAACIHRFQRLEEPDLDGSKFIQRGFACLSVDCLWNMIINCCKDSMKVTMFKKDTDHSVPTGTGINLLNILKFLLQRILELNHQSHLGYRFYLHNDFRFAADDKMAKVEDLQQVQRLQCYGSNESRWIDRNDLYIWFINQNQKTQRTHMRQVDLTKALPDRKLSFKEIGRVSKYIGSTYQTFFAELDCPVALVEQEMEEHRHLSFRSRIAKIFVHYLRTKADTGFLAIADAMSRHRMDPSMLMDILDSNRNVMFIDETLPAEWLKKCLSGDDVLIIADHVDIKSYFNLFLELGVTPKTVDEFDVNYRNKKIRAKITALLEAFIKETNPRPTVNAILLAMQECDMDTQSLTAALKPA